MSNKKAASVSLGDWTVNFAEREVVYAGSIIISSNGGYQFSIFAKLITREGLNPGEERQLRSIYNQLIHSIPPKMLNKSWEVFSPDSSEKPIVCLPNENQSGVLNSTSSIEGEQTIPWSYDKEEKILYYKGRAVNNIHANAVSSNQFAFMRAVIDAYPFPVSKKNLAEKSYGHSERGDDVYRRLYSGITLFNNTLRRHFLDTAHPIVYYSEPMQGFVLNVNRSEIPNESFERMGAEICGPIMIARKAARIWVEDKAMKRVGILDWDIMSSLFDFRDAAVKPAELAEHIYGEVGQKQIDLIHTGIRKVRKKINDISPDLGNQMITNSRSEGYRLIPVSKMNGQSDSGSVLTGINP